MWALMVMLGFGHLAELYDKEKRTANPAAEEYTLLTRSGQKSGLSIRRFWHNIGRRSQAHNWTLAGMTWTDG